MAIKMEREYQSHNSNLSINDYRYTTKLVMYDKGNYYWRNLIAVDTSWWRLQH